MVCIQCYLPPILFMVYMKLLHPFLAPFLEPAIDKVVGWIWGPQAVRAGCPIRPKNTGSSGGSSSAAGGDQPGKVEPTSSTTAEAKSKDD